MTSFEDQLVVACDECRSEFEVIVIEADMSHVCFCCFCGSEIAPCNEQFDDE